MALGYAFPLAAFAGAPYYVDCANGNDGANGSSPLTAWKSLEAVSSRTFNPGDSILLKRGTTCYGMLWPRGSGSASASIRIDGWGTGPLPKIQAQPGQEAAFRLSDQEYWTIAHLEFIGGEPHGIFIDGTKGILHGIHIRDVVVHGVTGEPKNKEEGLVVIASGTEQQHFDDVLLDGVTAYGTSEWAGIMVAGVKRGFPPEASRNTNVVIRNSIVHDVIGDGIVLFQVNKGLIENSVAWHTGMQDTERIGTPNAIWTWMCRDCTVRRCEAFLTDSPGVDGGAFDIDYGDDNNLVEENYGHDTQGYCVAVFGAGWVTRNSAVRGNVCAANGLSPRLAQRQGAIFLSTWNNGKLKDLRFSNNELFWNPPLAAAAVVNRAQFEGSGVFEKNTIRSSSPLVIHSNASLLFDNNLYVYSGEGSTMWQYDDKRYTSFQQYQKDSKQDSHSTEQHVSVERSNREAMLKPVTGKWTLLGFVSASPDDHDSRGEITLLSSAWHQFHSAGLEMKIFVASAGDSEQQQNLAYDWNLGEIPVSFDNTSERRNLNGTVPALVLVNPAGKIIWRHNGLTTPGGLGLRLRSFLGNPDYAQLGSEP